VDVSNLSRAGKLRDPAAIRQAVARRVLQRLLRRQVDPRGVRLETLGTHYGGWTVPPALIGEGWTVWSLGTGHDASFDHEILRRYPTARVRAFDPFARHLGDARRQAGDDPRYSQHQVAIAATDGPLTLTGDPDPGLGSARPPMPGRDEPTFEVPGRSVASLRDELGDDAIHLLKMDIEGAEYDVLERLDLAGLGVRILCCELHLNVSVARALGVVAGLRRRGYRLVACEDTDLTFVAEAWDGQAP
jgi:FkbM family methyltransferase